MKDEQSRIKIALASILLFLLFIGLVKVFNDGVIGLNSNLLFDNSFLVGVIHILLGILSGVAFVMVYKRYYRGTTPSLTTIFVLLILVLFVSGLGIISGISSVYGLSNGASQAYIRVFTVQQYCATISTHVVAPLTVFVFALLKLLKKKV